MTTLAGPVPSAPRPPSLANQLAAMRETAAAQLKAQLAAPKAPTIASTPPADPAAASDAKKGSNPADTARQAAAQARDAAKHHAQARVQSIVEQIKLLKKYAAENPEIMARQLARLAKELKSALEAYTAAGGKPGGGWAVDTTAPAGSSSGAPSEAGAEAAAPGEKAEKPDHIYTRMKEEVAGSPLLGDVEFIKTVKGVARTIRELMEKARIQTGIKGPTDETKKDFEDTETTLKDLDDALDDMERNLKATSPAAGMFLALWV